MFFKFKVNMTGLHEWFPGNQRDRHFSHIARSDSLPMLNKFWLFLDKLWLVSENGLNAIFQHVNLVNQQHKWLELKNGTIYLPARSELIKLIFLIRLTNNFCILLYNLHNSDVNEKLIGNAFFFPYFLLHYKNNLFEYF